jgi:hypothetical protein
MVKQLLLIIACVTIAFSGERKVLVEMFTNSHCSICPGAHAAIIAHAATSAKAGNIRYIYYHTTFPYPSDPLSQANTTEPNARNTYYNGLTSTPNTFFDGVNQGRTYSSFAANLDARAAVESPLGIQLSGTKNGQTVSVTASITQSGTITQNDLVIHMVAVEHVDYVGSNGVSPQKYVMRKMITPPAGDPFTPDVNNAKQVTHSAALTNITSISSVGVVVFVQSISTKEVFQSEYISYATLTGVKDETAAALRGFSLEQNYPNPFNPSTSITFTLPNSASVSLTVYDLLGNTVATLAKGKMDAGTHTVRFSATEYGLSSGMYFYRLESGGSIVVRKMLLLQ